MAIDSMFERFVEVWHVGFRYGLTHGLIFGACAGALFMAVTLYFWERMRRKSKTQ